MSKKNVHDGIKVASLVARPSSTVQLSDFEAEVLKTNLPKL